MPGRWQLYALTDAITDLPPITHRSLELSVLDRAVLRTARQHRQAR
ncbi:hypothetical protein [Rhodococcus sp. YH1]